MALHKPEFHSQERREKFRIDYRVGARTGAADGQLPHIKVIHRCYRRAAARGADRSVSAWTADVVQLERIELRALPAEQRLERNAAVDHSDHGAVFGSGVVDPVG